MSIERISLKDYHISELSKDGEERKVGVFINTGGAHGRGTSPKQGKGHKVLPGIKRQKINGV
jgi:hypothetical protein